MAERGCNRFKDAGGDAVNRVALADLLTRGGEGGGIFSYYPALRGENNRGEAPTPAAPHP